MSWGLNDTPQPGGIKDLGLKWTSALCAQLQHRIRHWSCQKNLKKTKFCPAVSVSGRVMQKSNRFPTACQIHKNWPLDDCIQLEHQNKKYMLKKGLTSRKTQSFWSVWDSCHRRAGPENVLGSFLSAQPPHPSAFIPSRAGFPWVIHLKEWDSGWPCVSGVMPQTLGWIWLGPTKHLGHRLYGSKERFWAFSSFPISSFGQWESTLPLGLSTNWKVGKPCSLALVTWMTHISSASPLQSNNEARGFLERLLIHNMLLWCQLK